MTYMKHASVHAVVLSSRSLSCLENGSKDGTLISPNFDVTPMGGFHVGHVPMHVTYKHGPQREERERKRTMVLAKGTSEASDEGEVN